MSGKGGGKYYRILYDCRSLHNLHNPSELDSAAMAEAEKQSMSMGASESHNNSFREATKHKKETVCDNDIKFADKTIFLLPQFISGF